MAEPAPRHPASRPGLVPSLLAAALACGAAPAHAAPFNNAFMQMRDYQDAIVQRVSAVVTGPDLNRVAVTLFLVLALALFVLKCTGWALRGFQLADMVQTVVQIMLTGLMLGSFTTVVPAIFNAALFVGQAMLAGLAGLSFGSSEAASLPAALTSMLARYGGSISPDCHVGWNPLNVLDCIKGGVVSMVSTLIMAAVLTVLCIAVMLVDIWGFWLYGIALAIGPVLVPFTLYKRLSFLFEGWLRFFFGTVVYVILAQVNLALFAVALLTYLGTTAQAVASGAFTAPAQPPVKDIADIMGMLLFCSVGIFALLATGRFASAIVSGAGGGGLSFDRIVQPVTRLVVGSQGARPATTGGARQGRAGSRARPARQDRGARDRHAGDRQREEDAERHARGSG